VTRPAHSPSIVARPSSSEAELAKEIDRPSEVIDDDSYVVHSFECHKPPCL
jgi:hypothetical protein